MARPPTKDQHNAVTRLLPGEHCIVRRRTYFVILSTILWSAGLQNSTYRYTKGSPRDRYIQTNRALARSYPSLGKVPP
jgi:hypothetical protein